MTGTGVPGAVINNNDITKKEEQDMKKFSINFLAFLLVSILFLGSYPVLYAQEPTESESEEFTLEEITVTAEKREENLQAVPRSLAVISADDLDLRSAGTVQDILSNTAGVSFFGFFNHFAMRGIAPNTNEAGSEPSVQFNIDGNLALNVEGRTSAPMFSAMNDVERIEVIRGPSGAINGRMAAAGTINVITKDPEFEKFDGYVGYSTGNHNTKTTKAAINIPLALTGLELPSYLENLALRFSFRQDEHSEYIHNADGEGVSGSQNYMTWRAKLKYSPVENININAQMSYSRDASNMGMSVPPIGGAPGVMIPGGPPFPMFAADPHEDDPWMNATAGAAGEPMENIQWNESLEASWAAKFGTLTAKYGHSWVPVECDDGGGGPPGPPGAGVCVEGEIGQKDYELRINSPEDSKLRWMVGAYTYDKQEYVQAQDLTAIDPDTVDITYTDFYGDQRYFEQIGLYPNRPDFNANSGDSNPLGFTGDVTEDSVVFISQQTGRPINSYSGYGNLTIPFFEDTQRFTVGLRKNFERKKRYTTVAIFGTNGDELPHFTFDPNDNDPSTGRWICDNCEMIYSEEPHIMETDDDPVNYTIGYEWDWKPEVMLYFNVNNGFKPGGISPNAVPAVFYKPEEMINYAFGTRSRWYDNTLQLNTEIYYMDYTNYQLNMAQEGELSWTASNGTTYTTAYKFSSRTMNLGATNIYGLELDYDWLITGRDRLKGNFEYKNAKFGALDIDRGPSANPPGSAQYVSFKGKPMPFAPEFTFYGSYSHRFTFNNIMVTPQFDVKWSDKYFLFAEYWWESVNPEMWQPSYFKYDAYLNIAPSDGQWQINAYGKNLTETVIRNASFFSVNIGDPRTYGIGLTINF